MKLFLTWNFNCKHLISVRPYHCTCPRVHKLHLKLFVVSGLLSIYSFTLVKGLSNICLERHAIAVNAILICFPLLPSILACLCGFQRKNITKHSLRPPPSQTRPTKLSRQTIKKKQPKITSTERKRNQRVVIRDVSYVMHSTYSPYTSISLISEAKWRHLAKSNVT